MLKRTLLDELQVVLAGPQDRVVLEDVPRRSTHVGVATSSGIAEVRISDVLMTRAEAGGRCAREHGPARGVVSVRAIAHPTLGVSYPVPVIVWFERQDYQ